MLESILAARMESASLVRHAHPHALLLHLLTLFLYLGTCVSLSYWEILLLGPWLASDNSKIFPNSRFLVSDLYPHSPRSKVPAVHLSTFRIKTSFFSPQACKLSAVKFNLFKANSKSNFYPRCREQESPRPSREREMTFRVRLYSSPHFHLQCYFGSTASSL